jgi:hypothetical protein
MPAEGFFHRWSRLKSGGEGEPRFMNVDACGDTAIELPPLAETTPHPPVSPAQGAQEERALPTIEDVAGLDANSDFSAFVTNGVDKAVQRLAMKKLFSDPHFHVMDGLDIYIDDYGRPDPLSEAMLASLKHAKNLFAPLLGDDPPPAPGAQPDVAASGDEPPPPQSPQDDA